MPLLDVTDWNNIQMTDATDDKRYPELGLVDSVKASTSGIDYISPSAKEAMQKASSLRQVEIPVIKDQGATVITTPGFANIPSNLSESDKYNFVAVDLFSGFRHYPAQYDNNMIDSEFDKEKKMKRVAYEMGKRVEGLLAGVLETRKTQVLDHTLQVSQGDGTYNFNAGTDVLEVSKAAQKATMFYELEALMNANNVGGSYRIATNRAGLSVQKSEALMHGSSNDRNIQALGMLDASRMHETDTLVGAGDIFNGWFFRDGAIGLIENYPYDFRNGTTLADKKWSITDVDLPFARMRANVYVNNQATEANALVSAGQDSNLIMTHFSEMALWLRFFIPYRYNTDITTRSNDIVKIKGLTT